MSFETVQVNMYTQSHHFLLSKTKVRMQKKKKANKIYLEIVSGPVTKTLITIHI